MDFKNIENDKYYCFGSSFYSNGSIDYKALRGEIEESQYYYASMMFDCDDIGFNIRMQVYSPAQWLFEADDYEVTEEDFKNFIQTKQFKRFAKAIPEKIQAAIGALQMVDEKELQQNGIKKKDVDRITSNSLRIMTIVKAACKQPKMKKFPK